MCISFRTTAVRAEWCCTLNFHFFFCSGNCKVRHFEFSVLFFVHIRSLKQNLYLVFTCLFFCIQAKASASSSSANNASSSNDNNSGKEDLKTRLDKLVNFAPVMLFMKGIPNVVVIVMLGTVVIIICSS